MPFRVEWRAISWPCCAPAPNLRAVRRTIIVGDVHGCAAELEDLLSRVGPVEGDRIVFVGDLVARGPDARRVLALFRSTGAEGVRGNHEERLLAAHLARTNGGPTPRLGGSHTRLLEMLDAEDWALLQNLPLGLELPEHRVRVVHAGVVPGVAWELQDPWMVTHIRSVAADGAPSERWGRPWGELYDGPPHVVFGHNAQQRVQLHRDASGIDTGCVYGGALTALVLPDGVAPPPVESRPDALVSVRAREAYADYGRGLP